MNRRKFLGGTALLTGALALNPFDLYAKESEEKLSFRGKKAQLTSHNKITRGCLTVQLQFGEIKRFDRYNVSFWRAKILIIYSDYFNLADISLSFPI
ncbi:twin-arginine translocation signal domain-containing protein [Chryseobacterium gambrini]|uniref:twin-arginine translocation signal domain-containing protein n=1 Tax=Chryseobacterium gambrini TaxID=373672 RepID=UPI003A5B9ABC